MNLMGKFIRSCNTCTHTQDATQLISFLRLTRVVRMPFTAIETRKLNRSVECKARPGYMLQHESLEVCLYLSCYNPLLD